MIRVEAPRPEEIGRLAEVNGFAFSERPSLEEPLIKAWLDYLRPEWCLVARDGEEIVGGAVALPFEVTLPGPVVVPLAGVSFVGVLPSHRRQGVLRALMGEQLGRLRRSGVALAGLTASEGGIYGRFGYGPATFAATWRLERHRVALRPDVPLEGRVELVAPDASRKALEDLFDQARRRTLGATTTPPPEWFEVLDDSDRLPGGGRGLLAAVHLTDPPGVAAPGDAGPAGLGGRGEVDGYALYRVDRTRGAGQWELEVRELVALSPSAEAGLWRFLLGVDLVDVVVAGRRPVTETLRWWLTDPRALGVARLSDGLWLRVLDVPRALEARRYPVDGRISLTVVDSVLEEVGGTFELTVRDGRGEVRRRAPGGDALRCAVADLGSLLLGGVAGHVLARSGRLTGPSEALRTCDQLFSWPETPWLMRGF